MFQSKHACRESQTFAHSHLTTTITHRCGGGFSTACFDRGIWFVRALGFPLAAQSKNENHKMILFQNPPPAHERVVRASEFII